MDYLKKAYCMNKTVRIFSCITTDMVSHYQKLFNMWPSSTIAFGKTLTISAIMGCTYKSGERLNIFVKGDGPIGKITVEATFGNVRGYMENPGVYLENNDGGINITKAIGAGEIEVVKDLNMREPFSSSSEIIEGDISNDFTYYFTKSEQIPSSVGLGVSLNTDSTVKAAGGFLIQIMPGCKDEYITELEKNLRDLKPITQMIDEGYSPEDIINEITKGDYELLEEIELHHNCNCSKERFKKGLKSLGKTTLEEILNEDKKIDIKCNFCNTNYHFDENELKEIIFEM